MNRWDIINSFIEKHNYKSYLEIGYYKGWSFDQVKCEDKTAIDPNPCKEDWWQNMPYGTTLGGIYKMTSDDGFKISAGVKWDIIFIDGLHEADQVMRDIENSLDHLKPGGTIIMHDCNPPEYLHTTTGIAGCWTGDTYKAFLRFKMKYPEYRSYVIDTDWGCGVIETPAVPGTWIDMRSEDLERMLQWEYFNRNRKLLLDIITVDEFKTKLNERTEDNNSPA